MPPWSSGQRRCSLWAETKVRILMAVLAVSVDHRFSDRPQYDRAIYPDQHRRLPFIRFSRVHSARSKPRVPAGMARRNNALMLAASLAYLHAVDPGTDC